MRKVRDGGNRISNPHSWPCDPTTRGYRTKRIFCIITRCWLQGVNIIRSNTRYMRFTFTTIQLVSSQDTVHLDPVSIQRLSLPGMWIPMLNIRHLYIETAPRSFSGLGHGIILIMYSLNFPLTRIIRKTPRIVNPDTSICTSIYNFLNIKFVFHLFVPFFYLWLEQVGSQLETSLRYTRYAFSQCLSMQRKRAWTFAVPCED